MACGPGEPLAPEAPEVLPTQQAIAPGCDSQRPTRIQGSTLTHDGRAMRLLIVNGYVFCNGAPVTPTRVNFWSNDGGAACGIQGYRSGAKITGGFYSSNYVSSSGQEFQVLAAGQCNAPSQKYKLVLWAPCNGVSMSKTFYVDVCDGCGPRVDVHFP